MQQLAFLAPFWCADHPFVRSAAHTQRKTEWRCYAPGCHRRSSADCITNTCESEFSVHTPLSRPVIATKDITTRLGRTYRRTRTRRSRVNRAKHGGKPAIEPNKQKTIGIVQVRSLRRSPAKHIDLFP